MRIDFSLKGDALLGQLSQAIQGRLTFGDNFQASIQDVSVGAADTEFFVQHNLGKIPIAYIATIDRPGFVYDSNRALWTQTVMFLKCSVPSAQLKLIVF